MVNLTEGKEEEKLCFTCVYVFLMYLFSLPVINLKDFLLIYSNIGKFSSVCYFESLTEIHESSLFFT